MGPALLSREYVAFIAASLIGAPIVAALVFWRVVRPDLPVEGSGIALFMLGAGPTAAAATVLGAAGLLHRKNRPLGHAVGNLLFSTAYFFGSLKEPRFDNEISFQLGALAVAAVAFLFAFIFKNMAVPGQAVPALAAFARPEDVPAEPMPAMVVTEPREPARPRFSPTWVHAELAAFVALGAAAACLVTIVAAGMGSETRLLAAVLDQPSAWLRTPALLGAVAGCAWFVAAYAARRREPSVSLMASREVGPQVER